MINKVDKEKAIKQTQIHGEDVGSPQVQISILTARIKEITEHLKVNKNDNLTRRGLIQIVGKRKKLLRSLEKKDFEAYKATVSTLGLRK